MEQSRRTAKIEEDTPIVPRAVADMVFDEATMFVAKRSECTKREDCGCLSCKLFMWKDELTKYLVDYANRVYDHNQMFAKRIRGLGNSGRNRLCAFMQHWLAAELKRRDQRVFAALPQGYGWDYHPR